MTKKPKAFSFAAFASDFDRHITTSIRGYTDLKTDCVGFSPYFIQKDTTILDVGSSTGSLLRRVRGANQKKYPSVRYVGIDIEPKFEKHWSKTPAENLQFHLCDVQKFDGLKNLSIVYSLFTLQFLPERDRLDVVKQNLRRAHRGRRVHPRRKRCTPRTPSSTRCSPSCTTTTRGVRSDLRIYSRRRRRSATRCVSGASSSYSRCFDPPVLRQRIRSCSGGTTCSSGSLR